MGKRGFEKTKSNIKRVEGAPVKKINKKRRRASRARAFGVITALIVFAVAIVLSMTVFFKIKSIDVYGDSRYTVSQIKEAGSIVLDSNLIRLNSETIEKRIEQKLPYIAKATIKKRLPTTVDIIVEEGQTAGYIEAENGNFLMSVEGKILEKLDKIPQKAAKIKGIKVKEASVSSFVSPEDEELRYIRDMYSALGKALSSEVTEVDVSDKINLTLVYRDRITIKLGSEADLEEKMKFVTQILLDPQKINDDDIGIIYASNAKRISFLRKGSYQEMLEQLESEKEQTTSSSIAKTETEDTVSEQNSSKKENVSSNSTSSEKEN